jgi:hypothetical protein
VGLVESLEGIPYIGGKVVAPDALCFADSPAFGAGRIWVAAASSRDNLA